MRILTFVQYYLPGYRSGGPVRSVSNLVDELGDEFEFWIVTRDRDNGDAGPYPDVRVGAWQEVAGARVFYASPAELRLPRLRSLIRATPHDLLYLNSLFDPHFTVAPLLLRRFGAIPRRPVIVSPKGELSEGALGLRAGKKSMFLKTARALGLYRDVLWQASVPEERDEIVAQFTGGGEPPAVMVASDLPTAALEPPARAAKRAGELRVVFASRITEKKNLSFVLGALARLGGPVRLDIFGVVEDERYGERCKALVDALAPGVEAVWRGPIPHEEMLTVLAHADLFFLPTLGENFGHVIVESLAAACPVLISDRTPWRDLDGAGWALSLDAADAFVRVLGDVRAMDEERHGVLRRSARRYAEHVARRSGPSIEQHRALFRTACAPVPIAEGASR